MEEERGRSPPNKQQRRDVSPTDSFHSTGSRGGRKEERDWEGGKSNSARSVRINNNTSGYRTKMRCII